jgi:hypothetical protein
VSAWESKETWLWTKMRPARMDTRIMFGSRLGKHEDRAHSTLDEADQCRISADLNPKPTYPRSAQLCLKVIRALPRS